MNIFSTTILIVFCSLLGSAVSQNECLHCYAPNSTECTNIVARPCIGDRCMSGYQIYEHGDKKFKSVFKGCANESLCGAYGSMTQDPDVKIRTYAICCEGKNCNDDKFYIPADNTAPNGHKCPSAYCEGTTEDCDKETKMMDCRGDETCCIEYRGRTQDPDKSENDYSVKSCINKQGCNLNFECLIGAKEIERKVLKC